MPGAVFTLTETVTRCIFWPVFLRATTLSGDLIMRLIGGKLWATASAGVLFVSLCLAAAPLPGITSEDLAVLVAGRLAGAPPGKTLDVDSARDLLAKSGLVLPQDDSSLVTEGALAEFFLQLGISVQAAHPSSPVSREQVTAVVNAFSSSLSARGTGTVPTGSGQVGGQGQASSSAPSSEETNPADICLSLAKTKDCRECCLTTIPGASPRTCGRLCGKQFHSSAFEPTP